ncbi:hypothetical protein SD80_023745 [Scytonema tolypothrichoides VB-61278]|nr:hypothetical protein SD80_023745 [Scytonema tolypothrichoides VB-61278]
MYSPPVKFIPVILGFTLALIIGDQVVQAQSLPPTDTPGEATPNSNQPSPSSTPIPPDTSSTERVKPRSLRNYIGVGGNIGISGDGKGLSHGGVTIIRKTHLSDSLSIRSTTVFGGDRNDATFALTVNFPMRTSSGQVQLVPFVGGGMLLRSKSLFEDLIVRGLVTGGVDVPLSRRFTATAAVNVGFVEETNVGVQLGVAYNF